ncbi:MAG: hypothetical protein IJD93_04925 [Ruminococcus sp.]|nr:hypothetical protein [Ruminococcus sp.]
MKNCKIINPIYPYNYQRMCLSIARLVRQYGEILCTEQGGRSTQGRCIPLVSLGKGKKKVLAVGAIHGREYVSAGYLLMCMEEYAKAFCSKELYCGFDLRKLISEYTLHFVPVANPDSVEIALGRARPSVQVQDFNSYFYKNNANDVNINANFPFEWQSVPKSRQGGESAGSEAETKLLMKLCETHRYEKMFSFHSRGDCIYWRDEKNGEIQKDKELSEKLSAGCGFSLCPVTENAEDYSGGFENWFRYRFARPALCIELVRDENAPFDLCCREFFTLTRWKQTRYALLLSVDD